MPRHEKEPTWMGPLPASHGCDCHVCRPDAAYDEVDQHTIDTVLQHGWQVVSVAEGCECEHPEHDPDDPTDADDHDEGPAFAYTLGLGHRVGHPELLVSGLPHELMGSALNNVARRVLAGRRLAPGDVLEDVLAGVPVVVEAASPEALHETVTWSGWFHRRPPEALVLVWPDRRGVFAWQPGGEPVLDALQPRAWRTPITHTGGVGQDPDWRFSAPPEHEALSCVHVVRHGAAVLHAAHDEEEGEETWTFFCREPGHTVDELRRSHLAHLVRSAPSLRALGDLGRGMAAHRPDVDAPWIREPLDPGPAT